MSPPVRRPIPRFIADATREGLPYGRWAERLGEAFAAACEPLKAEAGSAGGPGEVDWFPERAWGGRVFVPATAPAERAETEGGVEYFGYVSFARPEGGEPEDLRGVADFTNVTAKSNPDWQIDLNEEVIGAWRGEGERAGEVTLVWGRPLVPGAAAVTAELEGNVVDQAPLADGRFTLVAVDAVKGFPDHMYLEVAIWDQKGRELARDSVYDQPGVDPPR